MKAAPRLAPLPAGQWTDQSKDLMRGHVGRIDQYLSGAADAPPMPNLLGILGHHPRLAAAWLSYNGVLLDEPALDPRLRELMILRVAWRTRSEYEWVQHVRIGRETGLTDAQIEALASPGADDVWTPLEALLLAATDELLRQRRMGDETWAGLAGHLDSRQLLEVLFVIGSYLCLAMVFDNVDLELDPTTDPSSAPLLPGTEE